MDRARVCGIRDEGSIPSEDTEKKINSWKIVRDEGSPPTADLRIPSEDTKW